VYTGQLFDWGVILVILATTGVIFGAVYMLWMFQRVMFGKITREENRNLKDLSLREFFVLLPIIVMIFVIGIYPDPFLKKMSVSVDQFNAGWRLEVLPESSGWKGRDFLLSWQSFCRRLSGLILPR